MKSVIVGIALMVVVSAAGWVVMDSFRVDADDAYVSQNNSVRLD